MKLQYVSALILSTFAVACGTTNVHIPKYAGGDGFSQATPVVILGTTTDEEFRAAEAAWLDENLPGYRLENGNYIIGTGAQHVVKVLLPDGNRKTVYFDMSRLGR